MIQTLFIEEAYLAYFTPLIYHKVLINNKTEQDTEQDTTYKNNSGTVYIHSKTIYIDIITMKDKPEYLDYKHSHQTNNCNQLKINNVSITHKQIQYPSSN